MMAKSLSGLRLYSPTGHTIIDLAIIALVCALLYYSAWFSKATPKVSVLNGAVLIYKNYAGKTRDLTDYFAKMQPDIKDFMLDNDVKLTYPMAALYPHPLDVVALPQNQRCSIGFLDKSCNEKCIKFFKKEGYKVLHLPHKTQCITCEFPYRFD